MSASILGRVTGAVLAASLLFGPTAAGATAAARSSDQINPWAALSIFGTQSSQASLCGSAAAAAAAQSGRPGCVLPAVDGPPAPPVTEPVAVLPPALPVAGELGVPPLLLALAAIATGAFLLAMNDDGDDQPVSPG